ncbi:MAG TPA: hypothetical protein VFT59_00640 [Candidatus Saccharimonadales bacterium]|nr:hypothetical protein [Candidatus Saccharimonadales bacterium]
MNIQRFVSNNQEEPIFHSNAYAHVAHGSNIGSTDTQSFKDRLHVHRNRQAVRHYGDSLIGRGEMRNLAKPQIDNPLRQPERPNRRQTTRGVGLPQRAASPLPPRQPFREPPSRGYNPYN